MEASDNNTIDNKNSDIMSLGESTDCTRYEQIMLALRLAWGKIGSEALESQDGKTRNVSTIEIEIKRT